MCFFSVRARGAEKGIARHIDASSMVWTLVIFDWFVLSMRMQVILDSLYACPGSAPIEGGKKREFRDWTMSSNVGNQTKEIIDFKQHESKFTTNRKLQFRNDLLMRDKRKY